MSSAILLNDKDNVAVAVKDLKSGEKVKIKGQKKPKEIKITEEIPFGHKLALMEIKKGANIKKYGEVIGRATQDIESGDHVHIHNVESTRGRGDWD